MEPDDLPRKKLVITVGEPLDMISLAELEQRIEDLESEIARVKAMIASKRATKNSADAFFRS